MSLLLFCFVLLPVIHLKAHVMFCIAVGLARSGGFVSRVAGGNEWNNQSLVMKFAEMLKMTTSVLVCC